MAHLDPWVLALALSALSPRGAPPGVGHVTAQDRIVAAAEAYLGKPYVFGGRDGRPGCGRRRCNQGIDCLGLIFFAFEKALGIPWRRFSVTPSVLIRHRQLGVPVNGLNRVLTADLDRSLLRKGDVLLFLERDGVETDKPALVRGGDAYYVWHTALVDSAVDGRVLVIEAKPGDHVVIEPLDAVPFDALIALRLPPARRRSRLRPIRPNLAPRDGSARGANAVSRGRALAPR